MASAWSALRACFEKLAFKVYRIPIQHESPATDRRPAEPQRGVVTDTVNDILSTITHNDEASLRQMLAVLEGDLVQLETVEQLALETYARSAATVTGQEDPWLLQRVMERHILKERNLQAVMNEKNSLVTAIDFLQKRKRQHDTTQTLLQLAETLPSQTTLESDVRVLEEHTAALDSVDTTFQHCESLVSHEEIQARLSALPHVGPIGTPLHGPALLRELESLPTHDNNAINDHREGMDSTGALDHRAPIAIHAK